MQSASVGAGVDKHVPQSTGHAAESSGPESVSTHESGLTSEQSVGSFFPLHSGIAVVVVAVVVVVPVTDVVVMHVPHDTGHFWSIGAPAILLPQMARPSRSIRALHWIGSGRPLHTGVVVVDVAVVVELVSVVVVLVVDVTVVVVPVRLVVVCVVDVPVVVDVSVALVVDLVVVVVVLLVVVLVVLDRVVVEYVVVVVLRVVLVTVVEVTVVVVLLAVVVVPVVDVTVVDVAVVVVVVVVSVVVMQVSHKSGQPTRTSAPIMTFLQSSRMNPVHSGGSKFPLQLGGVVVVSVTVVTVDVDDVVVDVVLVSVVTVVVVVVDVNVVGMHVLQSNGQSLMSASP